MNKQVILGLLFSKDAEGQKSVEKISKKQITLIYVGILIYMLVSSLVEDGLKRIPDIHWNAAGRNSRSSFWRLCWGMPLWNTRFSGACYCTL